MCWISRNKLTFHNFTTVAAAFAIAANDDDPVVTLHHSCMGRPLLAEKED